MSWLQALPRMEAYVLNGAHFLIATNAVPCAEIEWTFNS
jgi:hypothetical protein